VVKNKGGKQEWQEFEKLIARIERTLAGTGAVVKHDDKVRDLLTGEDRQVDVTIRSSAGSAPILVTVECRKREKKSDVRWIEELAEKKRDIGADKTIVVSSSGLSEPALRKARFKGILARLVSEITAEDILSWCELTHIHYMPPSVHLREVHFLDGEGKPIEGTDVDESVHVLVKERGIDAPILHSDAGDITPRNLVDSFQNEYRDTELDLNSGVPSDGVPVRKAVHFPVEPNTYRVKTKRGTTYISGVVLCVEVIKTIQLIPVSKSFQYAAEDKILVQGVEFMLPNFDTATHSPLKVTLLKPADDGIKLNLEFGGKDGAST
jgi:hypothetical protein